MKGDRNEAPPRSSSTVASTIPCRNTPPGSGALHHSRAPASVLTETEEEEENFRRLELGVDVARNVRSRPGALGIVRVDQLPAIMSGGRLRFRDPAA
ncbi:hypothetical protein DL766_002880 [Monosporascus sp. MC13-8B]|uniref:Uncharacterized protein n=1 Tax=Monosporascus cannonballus TaxID=155416 RepID=A0ABY0HAB4_9PEZI|nr:hypothetical protein DL762_004592 [Monosporascus cannonballus]RYO96275.1 hypothetical protein DL763_003302 [Monosporascus cannonballus]RYP34661.1 hypothetical protein DL766_002880 [Monosporascus sp. MC13-8B]